RSLRPNHNAAPTGLRYHNAPPPHNPPRFRALALLGRRPPNRVDAPSSRRPRNLHRSGREQTANSPHSITSSAHARLVHFSSTVISQSHATFRQFSDQSVTVAAPAWAAATTAAPTFTHPSVDGVSDFCHKICHDQTCGPPSIAPNVQGKRRCLGLSLSQPPS